LGKVVLSNSCIIYYHGNDWDGVRARQRYLMEAMSTYAHVIYLDGSYASGRGRVTVLHPSTRVTVIKGLTSMLAAFERRKMSALGRMYAAWKLSDLKKFDHVMFWSSETWQRPYRFIRHDALIYDCIDPFFLTDAEAIREADRREIEQLRRADLVFASAASLLDRCQQFNPRSTLLNNGCEPADYADHLVESAMRPAWWPETSAPVAAYLGTLDWRVDLDLLLEVCAKSTSIHFVLAGYVLPECAEKVRRLQALPNVTCPGKISLRDGQFLLRECAVGLIPFIASPVNDAINPVKMYAYALMGKPIVGTRVRELASRPEFVWCATTAEGFVSMLHRALADGRDPAVRSRLIRAAQENTWSNRATQAWKAICGRFGNANGSQDTGGERCKLAAAASS
jgi:glycosyltransferase involved in cell wall biosynthesis